MAYVAKEIGLNQYIKLEANQLVDDAAEKLELELAQAINFADLAKQLFIIRQEFTNRPLFWRDRIIRKNPL